MRTFGDFEEADAFDTAPADPEQVARRLQRLRLAYGLTTDRWEDLTEEERRATIPVIILLLAWLRRQGAT